MPDQTEQPTEFSCTPDAGQSLHKGQQREQEETIAAQQCQQVMVTKKTPAEWHQFIGAARQMWSKVSEAELLASEGEEQKLTDIISARYVLSHNTANAQVKKFLTTQLIADWFQPAS